MTIFDTIIIIYVHALLVSSTIIIFVYLLLYLLRTKTLEVQSIIYLDQISKKPKSSIAMLSISLPASNTTVKSTETIHNRNSINTKKQIVLNIASLFHSRHPTIIIMIIGSYGSSIKKRKSKIYSCLVLTTRKSFMKRGLKSRYIQLHLQKWLEMSFCMFRTSNR